MGGTHRASEGQQSLWLASTSDELRCLAPDRPPSPARSDERPVGVTLDGGCPVGCRGTTECLCGQGEFSDDPLWIEND